MDVAVSLETVAPGLIAAVNRQTMVADVPHVIGAGWDVVWGVVNGKSLQHGRNVVLFRFLGGGAADLTCGVQVATRFEAEGEVTCIEMPGGRTATATHTGAYERIGETHRAVAAWALGNGHRLAGISWEIYEDWDDDPAKLRTNVHMLIETK